MKKSLSLLLAIALVFGMFYSVAAAATTAPTPAEAGAALKDYGIIQGSNGDLMTDSTWLRQDAVVLLSRLLKVEATAKAHAKTHGFTDVKGSFYDGYISWAKEEKYIKGNNAAGTTFGFGQTLTNQQFATIVLRVFGVDDFDNAVAKGIEFGILPAGAEANAPAKRGDTFVGLVAALNHEVPGLGITLGAHLGLPGFNVAAAISSVTATGAKKLTVTFNGAIDTAKAKYSVLNGTNPVNYKSVTPSEDKKSAVIEFANNLAEAEYTVKVEGLGDKALESKVKVAAEKASKIEFTSDKAALARGNSGEITVGYNVLNQYGEKINGEAISATASKGSVVAANGLATITAPTGVNFTLEEKVALSLVHTNGTFATTSLTVSTVAQVASVDIVSLYNDAKDGKELQVGGTAGNYYLVLDLKDQYGNSVPDSVYLDNGTDVIVSVSNPTAVSVNSYNSTANTANFGTKNIDGTNKLVLQLAGGLANGTSTVTIISKTTGAKDSFDIVVKDAVKVDTITLSAPSIAVAEEWVTIPFTAVDQFGNAVANPTDAGMFNSLDASGTGNNPTFVKDHVKNITELKLNLADVHAKGTVIVTIITGTNKVQQLTLNVVDPAVPTVITGTKDFETSVLKGGTVSLATGNIKVQDQYGRDFTSTDWDDAVPTTGKYRAFIESSSGNVTLGANNVNTGAAVVLTGADKGNSSITLKLQKYNGTDYVDVANSAYVYTQKVVGKDEITAYTASVDGKLLAGGTAAWDKELKVKGTLADGSTVTVTNDTYNYVVDIDGAPAELNYTPGAAPNFGKFDFDAGYTGLASVNEVKVNAVVVIKTATGQEIKTVELTVSKEPSAAATLAVNVANPGIATKEGDNVISVSAAALHGAGLNALINDAVETKDQYGVVIADNYTNYASNYSNSDRADPALVAAGDTFTVTAVSAGKMITLKVIVKA